jgi:hypothetical protein
MREFSSKSILVRYTVFRNARISLRISSASMRFRSRSTVCASASFLAVYTYFFSLSMVACKLTVVCVETLPVRFISSLD